MDETRWRNPLTGELLIHREGPRRRELLWDIHGDKGDDHSHAVWNNGQMSYVRDVNSPLVTDDKFKPRR